MDDLCYPSFFLPLWEETIINNLITREGPIFWLKKKKHAHSLNRSIKHESYCNTYSYQYFFFLNPTAICILINTSSYQLLETLELDYLINYINPYLYGWFIFPSWSIMSFSSPRRLWLLTPFVDRFRSCLVDHFLSYFVDLDFLVLGRCYYSWSIWLSFSYLVVNNCCFYCWCIMDT